MKVVILGAGNVATVLCAVIDRAGHEIVQVASRNIVNAKELAEKYNAEAGTLSDENYPQADIYIAALTDQALESIGKLKGLKGKFVVHTGGSIPMETLKDCTSTYGVLYPLQTLTKNSEDHIPEIPFLINGNNKETQHELMAFARSLSDKVFICSDSERLKYHVAAVFVGNFSNHLLAMGEVFCEKEKIDFSVLLPLINEVNYKTNHFSPFDMQTGPAIREDIVT
ncbi:MAG: DUF2520 domain-containing protein, partial [Ginsengibacter sp.]